MIDAAAAPPTGQSRGPGSLTELFWAFTWLALQGFGGVLAVVQRELVERRQWLTLEEFVDEWSVAQILPGPNVVNLALMLGGRYFGVRGAFAAMAGMLLFPLCVVLLLAVAFAGVADLAATQGALRGMGAVAAGLIIATGLRLLPALRGNAMGPLVCWIAAGTTFIAVAWWRLPLVWVLLGLGGLCCLWAWHLLGAASAQHRTGPSA